MRPRGKFGCKAVTTGLQLLGHRYYDPILGRFLTRDPIKDGRNWYVYCENDPVSRADPTGLWRGKWIGGMVGTAIGVAIVGAAIGTSPITIPVLLASAVLVGGYTIAGQAIGNIIDGKEGHDLDWADYVGAFGGGFLGPADDIARARPVTNWLNELANEAGKYPLPDWIRESAPSEIGPDKDQGGRGGSGLHDWNGTINGQSLNGAIRGLYGF